MCVLGKLLIKICKIILMCLVLFLSSINLECKILNWS